MPAKVLPRQAPPSLALTVSGVGGQRDLDGPRSRAASMKLQAAGITEPQLCACPRIESSSSRRATRTTGIEDEVPLLLVAAGRCLGGDLHGFLDQLPRNGSGSAASSRAAAASRAARTTVGSWSI